MIIRELKIFLAAISFFTRLPLYKVVELKEESLNKSSAYFPLTGIFIGTVGAVVFWGVSFILPVLLAVIISTAATIILTGAFHEDAFADVCDAFGGGWTKERILEIMKDSNIGAYGALGMIMIILTKVVAISYIELEYIPVSIIVAHSVSRLATVDYLRTHEYVSSSEKSKSAAMVKKISIPRFLFAVITGLATLLLLVDIWFLIVVIPVMIAKVWMAHYFKKWIGGYTGDCLGSVQQVTEVLIYISIIAILKFI